MVKELSLHIGSYKERMGRALIEDSPSTSRIRSLWYKYKRLQVHQSIASASSCCLLSTGSSGGQTIITQGKNTIAHIYDSLSF